MTVVRKFGFDVSFDSADDGMHGRGPSGGPGERMRAQIEEALAKGRETGIAEARASAEGQAAAALAAIAEQLTALEATRQQLQETVTEHATRMSRTLIGKMFPALARREALKEVVSVAAECMARLLDEPRIVIRVPDAILDALKAEIATVAERAGYTGDVVLLADDGLAPPDCHVEWADGGAERDSQRLWAEIDDAIQRALTTGRADAAPAAAQIRPAGPQTVTSEEA